MAKYSKRGLAPAFLERAVQSRSEHCVLWPFAKHKRGYGTLRHEGKMVLAHRLVCQTAHGAPPFEGAEAAHHCGNKLCVNPQHIRWATSAENARDRIVHGTSGRNAANAAAKLSEDDARSIRREYALGLSSQEKIGERYGISQPAVSLIVRRINWASLD